jgi:hypothetical protein
VNTGASSRMMCGRLKKSVFMGASIRACSFANVIFYQVAASPLSLVIPGLPQAAVSTNSRVGSDETPMAIDPSTHTDTSAGSSCQNSGMVGSTLHDRDPTNIFGAKYSTCSETRAHLLPQDDEQYTNRFWGPVARLVAGTRESSLSEDAMKKVAIMNTNTIVFASAHNGHLGSSAYGVV